MLVYNGVLAVKFKDFNMGGSFDCGSALDNDSKLKLTNEQKEAGCEIKTVGGMEVKTFDLTKINKIEMKLKLEPSSEEKFQKALDWIEEHKKKSVQHDRILKILTWTLGYCLNATLLNLVILMAMRNVIQPHIFFSFLPVVIAATFVYYVIQKIKTVSKNEKKY